MPTETLRNENVPKIYNAALKYSSKSAAVSIYPMEVVVYLRVWAYKYFSSSLGGLGSIIVDWSEGVTTVIGLSIEDTFSPDINSQELALAGD
jgi:hypothetical protein